MEFDSVKKLYEISHRMISRSPIEWQNFLQTACRNYKLRFDEQVLLYAQAPKATAILEASRWSRVFGRTIKDNAKGIYTFEDNDSNGQRVICYYDYSDTTPTEFARNVPIWNMDPSYEEKLNESLIASYKLPSGSLIETVKSVTQSLFDNFNQEFESTEKLNDFILQSSQYMILSRLDLEVSNVDFSMLNNFSEDEFDVAAYGTLMIARQGINEIAKIVNEIIVERSTSHGRDESNKNNIQEGGQIFTPELNNAPTAGMGNEILRTSETQILKGTSPVVASQAVNESKNDRTFEGGARTSGSDGRTTNETDDGERRSDRTVEGQESNGMGRQSEQYKIESSGDSVKRVDLRIEYFDKSKYQIIGKDYLDANIIREIFATTPYLKESYTEIKEIFEATDDNEDRAMYIENVFNTDLTIITLKDGQKGGYKKYANVIHVWLGDENEKTAEAILDWNVASRYFEAMRLMGELRDTIKPIASPDEQLNLIDELKAEINPSAFTFSQDLIDEALKSGSGFENGKMRIYEQCEKSDSISELTTFLKNEYGIGGTSSIVPYTGAGSNHDAKGIELYSKYYNTNILLNWSQVARNIQRLYNQDKYLSTAEKKRYVEWKEREEQRRIEREEKNLENLATPPPDSEHDDMTDSLIGRQVRIDDDIYVIESVKKKSNEVSLFDIETKAKGLYPISRIEKLPFVLNHLILETSEKASPQEGLYSFLDRLEQDCKYYLGAGNGEAKHLWARSVEGQISKMREIYNEILKKPEWITEDKISEYEKLMLSYQKKELKYEYHLGDTIYLGADKFEILSIEKDFVVLFNPEYPLLTEEFEKNIFEKRLKDNFRNDHLQVEISKAEYVKEPNHSIAEKLVDIIQDIDYFEYLDNLDNGETEEDVIQNIAEQITNEKYAEGVIEYLQKAEADDLVVASEQKLTAPDKFQSTPISERHNFNLLVNEIKEVGKKERFRRNIEAIKTLKKCETENRFANEEEQKKLANYVGWGGISEAFDEHNSSWANEYSELKSILTDEEYAAARESTLTAFYTPPVVIESIYEGVQNLGFKSGNILEPSCGIGHFIGMLPAQMQESKVYGIELDTLSAGIAEQLYQKSKIAAQGFETVAFPDNFFDLVVGNVPFGDFKVLDTKYDKHNFLIHDYFFAKSLDKLRPGGVMALITSKGTMDKTNPSFRKYIAQRAELLGAIRLPDNTFKGNAGTEVVSDIIFLQKRERAVEVEPDWIHLDTDAKGITMNSYFVQNPEMVLGQMVMESSRFGMDTTCKAHEGVSLKDELSRAIKNIQGSITVNTSEVSDEFDNSDTILADPSVRNYSFAVYEGKIFYRENSVMKRASISKKDEARVKALIEVRDAVRDTIEKQKENFPDEDIEISRKKLNEVYDKFQKKYGNINSKTNTACFKLDDSFPLMLSLETLDAEGNVVGKADIFTKRTIRTHIPVTSVDTSHEALAVSMGEKACVDMEYMQKLTGKSETEIYNELAGAIFLNPMHQEFEHEAKYIAADEYLSGNVRQKLVIAKLASEGNNIFDVNVKYLEQAQPKNLDASEITVRLGATWIEPEIVEQFTYELLNTSFYTRNLIKINFSKYTGEWFIENKSYDNYNINVTKTYGTARINAYRIIEDTLNLRDVRVYDYIDEPGGKKKAVLNKNETAIALSKQEQIKQNFQEWIWKDPERRERLVKYYNEKFNSLKPREYNGDYVVFSGINPEITLKQHQKNAIAHILYGGNTLLAHAVGAGKTFEMVAAAMETKRLGLCTKSLIVVPNHLTEQWGSEFMTLYPAANILVAKKRDFEPKNRKWFVSKIATGDYDAIIIGHSQFEKIPMSVESQIKSLNQQEKEILDGLAELKHNQGDKFSVKALEKAKKQVEQKLAKLNSQDRKDNIITFEELGIDRLFVDEAHYYKNLYLYTKMRNVGGIAQTEAMKSSDLYMKCRYLDEKTGGKGVIFATGTPISNSMVELYTMQRYLQYNTLVKNHLQHFDAWASTFGETVSAIELTPEGTGYRTKVRFANFYNLPELMSMFKEVADIQTADMLNLPVPKANFETIAVKPSALQKEMVASLADRAERIRNGAVDSSVDNMLKITNDGRKLALDQRLINPDLPDFEGSKLNVCMENMYKIWLEGNEEKTTQLFFCDLSTPKNDGSFSVYNDIKAKLVAKGIPEKEIQFIHDADSENKKIELFKKVRTGEVRILMGSTQKMGAGTNVQDKLIALHDLDCPWRPSDLEQRLGRIIRQGNNNSEVYIYRYVTEETFDAYLYQIIEGKQKFASQIMTSKSPARSHKDIDATALSYAEIKMLATGNPHIKEKMDLEIQVQKLTLLQSNYFSEKYSIEDKILKEYPSEIARLEGAIENISYDLDCAIKNPKQKNDVFVGMTIFDEFYADKEQAGNKILAEFKNIKFTDAVKFGSYRGFDMYLGFNRFDNVFEMKLKGNFSYYVPLGNDTYGNITRLDNVLDGLEKRLEDTKLKLDSVKTQLEEAKKNLDKPFIYADELKEKRARLNELNALLNIDKRENEFVSEGDASDSSPQTKKYVLEKAHNDLYRVKAVKDFENLGAGYVKCGDVGGYVSTEANLSQEGTCWIGKNAVVCDNAYVRDDAYISGNAVVCDDAVVSDDALVTGHAVVSEQAVIKDNACVYEYAKIRGKATIEDRAIIKDTATVQGLSYIKADTILDDGVWENITLTTTPLYHIQDFNQHL